jgi:outer membrane lipoprotein carrier protein
MVPVPMKRSLFLVTLLLLSAMPAWGADAVSRLNDFFLNTGSLQGGFKQTVVDENGKLVQKADGDFLLLRPGRFRWEYKHPNQQLIVSDGQYLWIYDPDLAQVTVKSIGKALGVAPIMLLSQKRKLSDDFIVSTLPAAHGLDRVELDPKVEDTDFRKIIFGLQGNEVRQMVLFDQFGQKTTIVFEHLKVNAPISPTRFHFTPPPGVDVINAAEPS